MTEAPIDAYTIIHTGAAARAQNITVTGILNSGRRESAAKEQAQGNSSKKESRRHGPASSSKTRSSLMLLQPCVLHAPCWMHYCTCAPMCDSVLSLAVELQLAMPSARSAKSATTQL